MAVFKSYALETTIHGFADLVRHESLTFRVLWSSCMATASIYLAIQIQTATTYYLARPTVTLIGTGNLTDFPPVALCPHDWMDPIKLRHYGITEDLQVYLLNYFPGTLLPQRLWSRNATVVDVWRSRRHVHHILNSQFGGHFESMLCNLAVNFTERGGKATLYEDNVEWHPRVKEYGVCWVFTPGKLLPPVMAFQKVPDLSLKIPHVGNGSADKDDPNYPIWRPQNILFDLFLGYKAAQFSRLDFIPLGPKTNIINILVSKHKRIKNCNKTKEHTSDICNMVCGRILEEACNCTCAYFMGDSGQRFQRGRYCNRIDPYIGKCDKTCLMGHYELCEKKCLEPCFKIEVTGTVSQGFDNRNQLTVEIMGTNFFSVTETKEIFSYPWTSLVGDLGGYLGLFLGASVLSISHALYFWIAQIVEILKYLRRKHGTDHDK